MRLPLLPLACAMLAGCAATVAPPPPAAPPPHPAPPPPIAESGLARVMGKDARALEQLFGPANLDVRAGKGRKLQYRGPACVLDAYLYPPATGGEPRVTWIDARGANGGDMDRASCIAALTRR